MSPLLTHLHSFELSKQMTYQMRWLYEFIRKEACFSGFVLHFILSSNCSEVNF